MVWIIPWRRRRERGGRGHLVRGGTPPGHTGHAGSVTLLIWSVFGVVLMYSAGQCSGQCQQQQLAADDGELVYRSGCPHGPGKCNESNTILLGGLFQVRKDYIASSERCTGEVQDKGYQRMMAMVYAIQELNKHSEDVLPPGVKLAFEMRDTCKSQRYTSEQVVKFLQRGTERCTSDGRVETSGGDMSTFPVSGIVGASSTDQSVATADLAELFHLPVISYASSGESLSNERYKFFFRVLPSDGFQARVVADLLTNMETRFFNLMHSFGNYGEDGAKSVQDLMEKSGWCIAGRYSLPQDVTVEADIQREVMSFLNSYAEKYKSNALVTVAFASEESMEAVFEQLRTQNVTLPKNFTWIATDSWAESKVIRNQQNLPWSQGTISIVPTSKKVPAFDDFFCGPSAMDCGNPWLKGYRDDFVFKGNTSVDDSHPLPCNKTAYPGFGYNFNANSKVPFVMDAVYAFAHAVKGLVQDKCSTNTLVCPEILQDKANVRRNAIDGEMLRSTLTSLNFKGKSIERISFNENGDLKSASYEIKNLVNYEGSGEQLRDVGSWIQNATTGGALMVNYSAVTWHSREMGLEHIPRSQCTALCQNGYQQQVVTTYDHCCWNCEKCSRDQFTNLTRHVQTCQTCGPSQTPNDTRDGCRQQLFKHAHLSDPFIGVCFVVALLLLFALAWVAYLMYRQGRVRLNEMSALKFPLLVMFIIGVVMAAVSMPIGLARPSKFVCKFQDFWVSLSLATMIVSIAARSMRGSIYHLRIHWSEHSGSEHSSAETGADDDSFFQDSGFADHKSSINSSPGLVGQIIEPLPAQRPTRVSIASEHSTEKRDSVFTNSGGGGGVGGGETSRPLSLLRRRLTTDRKLTITSTVSKASPNALDAFVAFVFVFLTITVLSITAASSGSDPVVSYPNSEGTEVYLSCKQGSDILIAGAVWVMLMCLVMAVLTIISMAMGITPPTVIKYAALAVVGLVVIEGTGVIVLAVASGDNPSGQEGVVDLMVLSFAATFLFGVVLIDVRDAGKTPREDDVFSDSGHFKRVRHGSQFVDQTLTPQPNMFRGTSFDRSPRRLSEQLNVAKTFSFDSPVIQRHLHPQMILHTADGNLEADDASPRSIASDVEAGAHPTGAELALAANRTRKKAVFRPRLERVISSGQSESGTDTSLSRAETARGYPSVVLEKYHLSPTTEFMAQDAQAHARPPPHSPQLAALPPGSSPVTATGRTLTVSTASSLDCTASTRSLSPLASIASCVHHDAIRSPEPTGTPATGSLPSSPSKTYIETSL
eukprot:scpid7915/ scgid34199/ Metabotropic glutamate receptor 7